MVELAGFPRALRACIGKIKSVAASRCAEAAAMAASAKAAAVADIVDPLLMTL
jgi:hypothetical protein